MKKSAISLLVSLLLCSGLAWGQSKIALENQVKGSLTITTGKTLTLVDMTLGSTLFAGTGGLVSQDNANFFWDNTAKILKAPTFSSIAADPADAGVLRLGNGEQVCWERAPTGTDFCITGTADEEVQFDGSISFSPGGNRDVYVRQSTTGNGDQLFVGAGDALTGALDAPGGELALGCGRATGNGGCLITFWAVPPNLGTGTATRVPVLRFRTSPLVDGIELGTASDVNFYRFAANALKTDDSFDAASFLQGGAALNFSHLAGTATPAQLSAFATEIVMIAAGCDNATAAKGLDIPTANGPTATCFGTAPDRFAYLDFADGANALTASGHFRLPAGWTGNIDLDLYWACSAATCSTNNVSWNIQTVCVGDGEDFLNPTYNALQEIVDAGLATLHLRNRATQTAVTTTGCAAGETFFFQLNRDPTDASDTFAGTAGLLEIVWTLRRTPQS